MISDKDIFIDVRTEEEFAKGHIENAINIPLDSIRERMHEIDKTKKIYLYCLGGQRGYLAQRILKQHGYTHIANLSGGYKIWEACSNEQNYLESELKKYELEPIR